MTPLLATTTGPAIVRRLGQPGQPAFEAEAVDDDELRLSDEPRLIRARLEDMRVGVGPDEARHRDIRAADLDGQ